MSETKIKAPRFKKPKWLRVKLPVGEEYKKVRKTVDKYKLHTICESGNCPNMVECWGAGTATFMILGNVCTRSCTFCAVATGRPPEYDEQEPTRVAKAIKKMGVKHAVITSVNRDELKDRGSEIWYQTVYQTKQLSPETTIETLIPDVRGNWDALYRMIDAGQEVVSHNIETVERLYKRVRPQARYERSLEQIKLTKEHGMRTKSGIMVGLGEEKDEVIQVMDDLRSADVDFLTIGQYLQPTVKHHPLDRYYHPDEFKDLEIIAKSKGFLLVSSSPLTRSSYHADEDFAKLKQNRHN